MATAVARTAAEGGKTCVTCFLGTRSVSAARVGSLGAEGADEDDCPTVPSFPTPEDAVRALAAVVRYAQWRRKDRGHPVAPEGVDLALARTVVEHALAEHPDGTTLAGEARDALLEAVGIPLLPRAEVRGVEEALEAAERFGWPVALKTVGEALSGRQDLRGVRLGLSSPEALRLAVEEMHGVFGAEARTLAVQPMAPLGVPCLVRSTEDPLFGPVLAFGVEGDPIDLMGDVAYRIPPLTDVDVADLVRSVKAAPKLFGHRGSPALDVPALQDVVARVAVLADALPEIAELRLSPVLVAERGVTCLDAVVRVAAPQGRADPDRRTLPL